MFWAVLLSVFKSIYNQVVNATTNVFVSGNIYLLKCIMMIMTKLGSKREMKVSLKNPLKKNKGQSDSTIGRAFALRATIQSQNPIWSHEPARMDHTGPGVNPKHF